MVAQQRLLNPIESVFPNSSKGFSIYIKFEAKASFCSVVFPSSKLACFPLIHIFQRTNFIDNGHPWIEFLEDNKIREEILTLHDDASAWCLSIHQPPTKEY